MENVNIRQASMKNESFKKLPAYSLRQMSPQHPQLPMICLFSLSTISMIYILGNNENIFYVNGP